MSGGFEMRRQKSEERDILLRWTALNSYRYGLNPYVLNIADVLCCLQASNSTCSITFDVASEKVAPTPTGDSSSSSYSLMGIYLGTGGWLINGSWLPSCLNSVWGMFATYLLFVKLKATLWAQRGMYHDYLDLDVGSVRCCLHHWPLLANLGINFGTFLTTWWFLHISLCNQTGTIQ